MKNGDAYRQMICQQIEDLINKAHLNDDDRAKIQNLNERSLKKTPTFCLLFHFSSSRFAEKLTADLLDVYDTEYERIRQLYEKRKPMLDAFEKWAEFWKEFVEFTVKFYDQSK